MHRFAYLIPRLILLGLAFLAVSIAGDSITQRLVTAHVESSIGMDVEIGRFRTRAAKGKVFVNDFALVDPARPMKNLFQADLAFFEVDLSAISRRQLVIQNARASQVRLGVPRTEKVSDPMLVDSSLKIAEQVAEFQTPQTGEFWASQDSIRMAWLDQFANAISPEIAKTQKAISNPLYELASATNEKWNKGFQQQNGQLKSVSASFAKIASGPAALETIERTGLNGPPNPLRARGRNQPDESELDEIIAMLQRLHQQQLLLERQAAADIARLEAAYQSESDSKMPTRPAESEISSQTLSQLLLTDLHQNIANEAMDWFLGFRNSTSVCATSQQDIDRPLFGGFSNRGESIEIAGAPNHQPTVVKKLTFDGAGRFNQQHFNFAGTAFDITDRPDVHDLPTTFNLRAQGDQHFVLRGSIDRRGGGSSDSLTIDFPSFPLGPRQLGTESEMLVTTGPRTTAHGKIHIQIDGQAISGKMRLDFSQLAMVVEHLHDVAGGKEVAVRLNQTLSTLQHFESTATLGGTLEQPELKFESSLGERLASEIAHIKNGKLSDDQLVLKNEIDQFYQTQVVPLKSNIATELDTINRSIESQIVVAKRIRTSIRAAKSQWPEVR